VGALGQTSCSLDEQYEWLTAQILSGNGKREEVERDFFGGHGLCQYFPLTDSVRDREGRDYELEYTAGTGVAAGVRLR
jgi:hypothetical protein